MHEARYRQNSKFYQLANGNSMKRVQLNSFLSWTVSRADYDALCYEQLKATHLRASPKQQALLDVLLQLIKTWPLTIGPWTV